VSALFDFQVLKRQQQKWREESLRKLCYMRPRSEWVYLHYSIILHIELEKVFPKYLYGDLNSLNKHKENLWPKTYFSSVTLSYWCQNL